MRYYYHTYSTYMNIELYELITIILNINNIIRTCYIRILIILCKGNYLRFNNIWSNVKNRGVFCFRKWRSCRWVRNTTIGFSVMYALEKSNFDPLERTSILSNRVRFAACLHKLRQNIPPICEITCAYESLRIIFQLLFQLSSATKSSISMPHISLLCFYFFRSICLISAYPLCFFERVSFARL